MRIALRTSGGRGEYELAGTQGEIGVPDLLDLQIHFKITPELSINGHGSAKRMQGKPRIRMEDPRAYRHPYRVLTAVALLPVPKRELRTTSNSADFVFDQGYAVTAIDIDVDRADASTVDLRPKSLWLGNALGLARRLDFQERMALVQTLWDLGRNRDDDLGELVRAHESASLSGNHGDIERAAADLRGEAQTASDPLLPLLEAAGAESFESALEQPVDEIPDAPVDDETAPQEAARRAVSEWRKVAIRSSRARAFSTKVRAAYGHRCVVTGDALPKLPSTAGPGVDAAHILPWSRYELNSISNGLCLNKLWHWAFDAGTIRIDFAEDQGEYTVSVPDQVESEAKENGFSLDHFLWHQGAIDESRLPADSDDWPSPTYLNQLNEEMFGLGVSG